MLLCLSGCKNFSLDITELMSPPETTGDEAVIQQLISDSSKGQTYTLKYPQRGDYGSAVIMKDIDNDGEAEAIAFYQTDELNETTLHMLLMDEINNQWSVVSNQSVTASGVDKVEFCDLTGNGRPEIIVGYNSYSDSLNQLYVYTYSEQGILTSQKVEYNYSEFIAADFDTDSLGELFLMSTDDTSKLSVARLLKFSADKKFEMLGQVDLNQSATSYVDIKYGKINNNTYGAFIDSVRSANKYCTEVVYYDTVSRQLKNPLNFSDSNKTNPTLRDTDIISKDIDKDGIIEIPAQIPTPTGIDVNQIDSNYMIDSIISWNTLDVLTQQLNFEFDSVVDEENGYYFVTPKEFETQILVLKNKTDDSIVFKQLLEDGNSEKISNDILTLKVFNEEQWNSYNDINEYIQIDQKGKNVYTAKIPNSNNVFGVTIDTVIQSFNFINS